MDQQTTTDQRVLFDFAVEFLNGGGIQGQGFRLDIEGDSVNFAARLEPLAEPGEVLITEDLRYHPEVQQDRFLFLHHKRSLKKAVGDQQQGDIVECYSVKYIEESQK